MEKVPRGDVLRELKVLIVDDNPGDRLLYRSLLLEADPGTGYHFEEADCAAAALDRLRDHDFDCMLLDYLLPDQLGLDLLRALNEQDAPRFAVIMLTGFGDEATAVSAMKAGAQGYVPKRDLDGKTLLTALDQAISAHRRTRAVERHRSEMDTRNRDLELRFRQAQAIYRDVLGKLGKPVRGIRDRVSSLAEACAGMTEPQFETPLLELQAETDRLLRSLLNLMDNPGMNLGQLLVSTQPQPLTEVVNDAVKSFRAVADAADVRVSVRLQPGLPNVPIDRFRIEQVLLNLLDNAIRFTPPQGKVSLQVEESADDPRMIEVSVRDTGCGIPADRQQQLFQQPSAGATGPDGGGLGLGLPICKEIIQSHGGTIRVDSAPEQGTRVTFSLPLGNQEMSTAQIWDQAGSRTQRGEWRLSA